MLLSDGILETKTRRLGNRNDVIKSKSINFFFFQIQLCFYGIDYIKFWKNVVDFNGYLGLQAIGIFMAS